MNCLDCQAWLQQRMDGEAPPVSEPLERHWGECATCRAQHAAMLRLLEGVQQLPRPALPPGYARQLANRIVQDRRQRQVKMRRRVLVTLALAASVLLLLLAGYNMVPPPPHVEHLPKAGLAQEQPKENSPAPNPQHAEQKSPRKKEPRNAITPLIERWADTTRGHAAVVLAATDLDAMQKLPAIGELPAFDPGVREAGQEVSDGVRAVTRNARRAFDFLARELPMPEIDSKEN
jgi:hypothetical protein